MHALHCNQLCPQQAALPSAVCAVQALLALPAITPAMLAQFEADVAATGSEKEQRLIIRKLLMQSGTLHCTLLSFFLLL